MEEIKLQCPECLQENATLVNEIYQECITPRGKPARCIAVMVPAGECRSCGHKWWTQTAINAIEEAFLDSLN